MSLLHIHPALKPTAPTDLPGNADEVIITACASGNTGTGDATYIRPAAFERPLPVVRIETRRASPISDDKVEAGSHCGLNAFPAQKFAVGADQNFLDEAGNMVFDVGNNRSGLFGRHRGALAQLANQIFMGFLDKSRQRPQARFAAMLWIRFDETVAMTVFPGGFLFFKS
jgi:hypothetical protein